MKLLSNKPTQLNRFFQLLLLSFVIQQFAIPTPVTPLRPYMIMVLIGGVVCLLNNFRMKLTIIDLSLSALYCYMMVTIIYAGEATLSIQMFFGLILLLYSYFILRLFICRYSLNEFIEQMYIIAKWFFILSFFSYLIGIIAHYMLGVSLILEGTTENRAMLLGVYFEGGTVARMRGLCDSPNNFGMYAVLMLPIWINYSPGIKWWQAVSVALMIILTLSVTTYLALICMLLMFLSIKIFNLKGKVQWKTLVMILSFILLIFALIQFVSFIVLGSTSADLDTLIKDRLSRVNSGSGRFELWKYSWSLIEEQPIWGYGLNQARVVLSSFRDVNSTHNNFLEVTLEGGFVGFLLYLLFIFIVFMTGFSTSMAKKERQWVVMTLIGVFVFSNANVNLYADSSILVLAIIASLPLLKNSQSLLSSSRVNNLNNERKYS
jgi:O-antigen ligase